MVDGQARFSVLTPTLVRLEWAADGRFEDRPTQLTGWRPPPSADYTATVEDGVRVIRTTALTLRYRQGSGPFGADNLEIALGDDAAAAARPFPPAPDPQNLGGWRRGLDNEALPVPLHEGLLSRRGWTLLDDSGTVLLTDAAPGFAPRTPPAGGYQDAYFFGYGSDYAQALADLRHLAGAAPLPPQNAFGVWYSRYWAYSDAELREVVAQFDARGIPLHTLSLDTDWKRMHSAEGCVFFDAVAGARPGDPCSWNGWDWNPTLFPDPAGFVDWAHARGIHVGLNVHPSINSRDPHWSATAAAAGALPLDTSVPPCTLLQADPLGRCHVFDWTDPAHLDAYFALHAPLAQGADFWWLDWCCDGSRAQAPGLTADTWINSLYHREHEARGSRWPAFSRIGASFQEGKGGRGSGGAFAEHRHTMHFTGDTCGTWEMLAFESQMTAAEGAGIGLPFVSHDIGSFLGPPVAGVCNGTVARTPHLPDDLYVRWVQFGAFQPVLRLHSHHGDRLPWEYPGAPGEVAADFLRLRAALLPYLYTLAREAHDTGLPMVRALYLQWPELEAAYAWPTQYTLGDGVLVAPVTAPGDPAPLTAWIPPGRWTDWFTGETVEGPQVIERSVPLSQYPVWVREGTIVPTLEAGTLVLNVAGGAAGQLRLYEDDGESLAYREGQHRWSEIVLARDGGCSTLRIGAPQGLTAGAPARPVAVRRVGAPGMRNAGASVDLGCDPS